MSEIMADNSGLKGDYSPMEQTIFAALIKRGKATSHELVGRVYTRKNEEPFNARIIVNRAATTLGLKLKRNHEAFRLERKKLPLQRTIENRLIRK